MCLSMVREKDKTKNIFVVDRMFTSFSVYVLIYMCCGTLTAEVHPQTLAVVRTRAAGFGITVKVAKYNEVDFKGKTRRLNAGIFTHSPLYTFRRVWCSPSISFNHW